MNTFQFRVEVETHSETGRVVAVYFQFRRGKSATVKEYEGGNVFADYDRKGELLGIEMLAPCKVSVLNKIAVVEPAKRFIKSVIPPAMLVKA